MLIIKVVFWISAFIIFWAMIGYPLSLLILGKVYKKRKLIKDYSIQPKVAVMIVAHNEEKVIRKKLENMLEMDYPLNKLEFVVSSDNSNDSTNSIVREFISEHPCFPLRLFEVKERKGKTNAQNEAQKTIDAEILVMTDANAILEKDAIKELVSAFTSDDITYVTGRLVLVNKKVSKVSSSEKSYWDLDSTLREIEGRIWTITAGNGALYACRNEAYIDFEPILSHDSAMPLHYALLGKRAIANHDAIAFEKAGETLADEFKRKVRMNRIILTSIVPKLSVFNVIKYGWFSYFYFGHRTCRYLLWISHLLLLISNLLLIQERGIYVFLTVGQLVFYALAWVGEKDYINYIIIRMANYYVRTIFAQWIGVYNSLTGKSKPF